MSELRQSVKRIVAELTAQRPLVLCTILRDTGSAPRHAGTRMALLCDGTFTGTVGGGAVEEHSKAVAREIYKSGGCCRKNFLLHKNERADIGMICGGDVDIYFQHLDPQDLPTLKFFSRLDKLLDGGRGAYIAAEFAPDLPAAWGLYIDREGFDPCGLSAAARDAFIADKSPRFDGKLYIEALPRAENAYIFGAGHVGQALCPLLSKIGFRVYVFDTRAEVLTRENFPDADTLISGDYDHIADTVTLDRGDYVAVMTPGHSFDYAATLFALSSPARYVGCIGSRKKVAFLRQRLLDAGISAERADELHAPIGLPIGGETPAEIAVSIAAEFVQERYGARRRLGVMPRR